MMLTDATGKEIKSFDAEPKPHMWLEVIWRPTLEHLAELAEKRKGQGVRPTSSAPYLFKR